MGSHASGGMQSVLNTGVGAVAATLVGGGLATVGGAVSGMTANGINQAAFGGTMAGLTAGASGLAQGAVALMPQPGKPGMPALPPMPAQASSAVPSVGGYNMKLAQQLAMSAGGTLFNTPKQWWSSQQIGNLSTGGGKQVVGA